MAHKTKIGETIYEITGGRTKIGDTAYEIIGGKTKIGDTVYDISFGANIENGFDGVTVSLYNVCQQTPHYVNDTFFILPHSYTYGDPYWSKDGKTWTKIQPYNQNDGVLSSIVYGNGVYVIGGLQIGRYSYDLTTWTTCTNWSTSTNVRSGNVVFGNGIFLRGTCAQASSYYQYSTDGITWTSANLPASSYGSEGFGPIYFTNGKFFVAGRSGGSSTRKILTSTNGTSWSVVGTFTDSSNVDSPIVYGNGVYVQMTAQYAYSSTNGTTWTQTLLEQYASGSTTVPVNPMNPSAGTTTVTMYSYYHDHSNIVYANGMFVSGKTCSTDGKTWNNSKITYPFSAGAASTASTATAGYPSSANLGVANDYFVVSEYANIYKTAPLHYAFSTDCVNWTTGEFPFPVTTATTVSYTGPWSKIIYGNDIYLAVELGTNRIETDPYCGSGAVAIIE